MADDRRAGSIRSYQYQIILQSPKVSVEDYLFIFHWDRHKVGMRSGLTCVVCVCVCPVSIHPPAHLPI
jgi:hypothetical protein